VLQDVLKRVQKAFDGFFRRIKTGQKAGYPRFAGRNRYDSFCFPQGGWSLQNNRLTLSKIGTIKLKLHREVMGKVKTYTIKRDGSHHFLIIINAEIALLMKSSVIIMV
jgi:putative transposase